MGFLVSAGIYVDDSGERPPRLPLFPREMARNDDDAVSPFLLPADSPDLFGPSLQPQPRRPGSALAGSLPLTAIPLPPDLGSIDDDWLSAWAWPEIRPTRLPQEAGQADTQYMNQTGLDGWLSDAGWIETTPRRPALPPMPNARTDGQEQFLPEIQAGPEVYVACTQPLATGPQLLPDRIRDNAEPFVRTFDLDPLAIAWMDQTAQRPAPQLPPSATGQRDQSDRDMAPIVSGAIGTWGDAVSLVAWWQDNRPPRQEWPGHRDQEAPPWLGCFSIIVPGPFYAIAGQVSPAAGAVQADVRTGGED